jgi:FdhD protein
VGKDAMGSLRESSSDARVTQDAIRETQVRRFVGLEERSVVDVLAVEEPLEIQLGYGPREMRRVKSISVTMRTPGQDFALAAGFLLTEGVVRDGADIERIEYVLGPSAEEVRPTSPMMSPIEARSGTVRVELIPGVEVNTVSLERNFYATSSCGVCGKASLLALRAVCPPRRPNTLRVEAGLLYSLPASLRRAQGTFDRTGGLHAAGLFDERGELRAVCEDVGRHNAVDKLLGSEFLADRVPLRNCILLLSGRASFELVQKALMGGISMVVSVGAPSSLAVEMAREFDITLVGFLREGHFNVYHGSERVTGSSQSAAGV